VSADKSDSFLLFEYRIGSENTINYKDTLLFIGYTSKILISIKMYFSYYKPSKQQLLSEGSNLL
jgi:hypothetical protein